MHLQHIAPGVPGAFFRLQLPTANARITSLPLSLKTGGGIGR